MAWVDTLATGKGLGRGVFCRARHSKEIPRKVVKPILEPRLAIPIDFPGFVLNRMAVGIMNRLYRGRVSPAGRRHLSPFGPVLFPLDSIGSWNSHLWQPRVLPVSMRRPAGRLPRGHDRTADGDCRRRFGLVSFRPEDIRRHRLAGLLSFPRPGTTLALDFANRGAPTLALLDRLDAITRAAGGRVIRPKDGRMSAETFAAGYPDWLTFAAHVDPVLLQLLAPGGARRSGMGRRS